MFEVRREDESESKLADDCESSSKDARFSTSDSEYESRSLSGSDRYDCRTGPCRRNGLFFRNAIAKID